MDGHNQHPIEGEWVEIARKPGQYDYPMIVGATVTMADSLDWYFEKDGRKFHLEADADGYGWYGLRIKEWIPNESV